MKRNLVAMAVVLTAASASSAFAADGTVNFTGQILDQACTVSVGTNNTLDVNLGKVAKTAFPNVGDKAAATKFTIKLTSCPAALTSATVKFDGITDSTNNSYLAITSGSGVATGVAIALYDATQSLVPMLTASSVYQLSSTSDNNLDFFARYISTKSAVTAGPANAVSTFTIVYN